MHREFGVRALRILPPQPLNRWRVAISHCDDARLPRLQIDLEGQFVPLAIAIQIIGLRREFHRLQHRRVLFQRCRIAGRHDRRACREILGDRLQRAHRTTTFCAVRASELAFVTASFSTFTCGGGDGEKRGPQKCGVARNAHHLPPRDASSPDPLVAYSGCTFTTPNSRSTPSRGAAIIQRKPMDDPGAATFGW